MTFTAEQLIRAPRENVFAAMMDPDILQRCVEGCRSLVATGPDTYDAQLQLNSGIFSRSCSGRVRFTRKNPPEACTLVIEAKSGGTTANSTADFSLLQQGDATHVRCAAKMEVHGILGFLGGAIQSNAKAALDNFLVRLAQEVEQK